MFKKKKFLRIIAVGFAVLGQLGVPSSAWGMKEEMEEEPPSKLLNAISMHRTKAMSDQKLMMIGNICNSLYSIPGEVHKGSANVTQLYVAGYHGIFGEVSNNNCEYYTQLATKRKWIVDNQSLKHVPMEVLSDQKRTCLYETVIKNNTIVVPSIELVSNCLGCEYAYHLLSTQLITAFELKEKENNELKKSITLLQDKNEELCKSVKFLKKPLPILPKSTISENNNSLKTIFEKDIKNLKLQITSLQEENNNLKQLFTTLPSTKECELFNMSEEQFLNEGSSVKKIRMLYQGVHSLNKVMSNLKQKENEFIIEELEDKNIISLSTQIISENQVPEYCVSILLKKDPQIFLPWASTKTVFEVMFNEVSLKNNSLPSHILVEDEESKEGGILLSSYIKRELEHGLDAKISIEGKNKFENMVFDIEKIQGDFWKENESISVPILLKKLNEGDGDKEWVPGWSNLEEAYKKYIAATVLYKMSKSKRSLPKKYEDIESYLMDR